MTKPDGTLPTSLSVGTSTNFGPYPFHGFLLGSDVLSLVGQHTGSYTRTRSWAIPTVISGILQNEGFEVRTWTLDLTTIEKRLLNDLTPSTLEHLIVSLLQLEHPDEVWTQVGGSGDGGVDGVGASQDGHVTGLLKSKWQYWGEDPFPSNPAWRTGSQPFRKYLAALRYPDRAAPPHCIFLNRPRIAELVAKHYLKLPQALSMRIGNNPDAPCP
jgi:hypothetical protein